MNTKNIKKGCKTIVLEPIDSVSFQVEIAVGSPTNPNPITAPTVILSCVSNALLLDTFLIDTQNQIELRDATGKVVFKKSAQDLTIASPTELKAANNEVVLPAGTPAGQTYKAIAVYAYKKGGVRKYGSIRTTVTI